MIHQGKKWSGEMSKAKGGTGRGTDKKGWTRWGKTKVTVKDNSKNPIFKEAEENKKKSKGIPGSKTGNNMDFNPKK
jgi:hypothetical protein